MSRVSQIGIAIGLLGAMIMLMGLFPGITGVSPTSGMGIVQIFVVLVGFTLLIFGALVYVKFAFYASEPSTLMQQIGTRLALTGLVLAGIAALADALGFGSHGAQFTEYEFLGPVQGAGILGSFMLSCLGVLVYAIGGDLKDDADEDTAQDDDDEEEI